MRAYVCICVYMSIKRNALTYFSKSILDLFRESFVRLSYSRKNDRSDYNHSSREIMARDVRDGIA